MAGGRTELETNWKRWAIIEAVVIALLLVGGGLFGPALVKKYSKTEVKVVEKVKTVTKTVRVPVFIGGTVAYREETTAEETTDTDTHATDTQKESKQRNLVTIGFGCDNEISPSVFLAATIIGPLGLAGEVTFKPDPISFKSGHLWATLGL